MGTTFTYTYRHLTQQGDTLLFALDTQNQSKWHFVKKEKADSLTIDTVVITVLDGNPMADRMPDYNQTNLKYQLQNTRSYSTSGVIENEGNIWMHPPRQAYFRILELNPFPYIKAPYEVGTAWTWSLDIGSAWGDERWKTWEGGITNTYTYTITDERILPTAMGNLKCYLIKAEATSDLGKNFSPLLF